MKEVVPSWSWALQGRHLTLQGSCLSSAVFQWGGTAFPGLFILLSRAGIRHQDNWARMGPDNSLCAEPRLITPFDP